MNQSKKELVYKVVADEMVEKIEMVALKPFLMIR